VSHAAKVNRLAIFEVIELIRDEELISRNMGDAIAAIVGIGVLIEILPNRNFIEGIAFVMVEKTKSLVSCTAKPRRYISLTAASAQFGREIDDLLDLGVSGRLNIYAPVLSEGRYVWPVTNRGLQWSQILGTAPTIFEARFKFGEPLVLHPEDVKRVKVVGEVVPQGYINSLAARFRINEWIEREKEEHALEWARKLEVGPPDAVHGWQKRSIERMRALVRKVAWIPGDLLANDILNSRQVSLIRLDMLRIAVSEIDRLYPETKQTKKIAELQSMTAKEKHKRKVELILAGAEACGYLPSEIPDGGKTKIRVWCQEHHSQWFGNSTSPFEASWKKARAADVIRMKNHNKFNPG